MKYKVNCRAALILTLILTAALLAVAPALHEAAQAPVGSSRIPQLFRAGTRRAVIRAIAAEEKKAFAGMLEQEKASARRRAVAKERRELLKKASKKREKQQEEAREQAAAQEEQQITDDLYQVMGTSSVTPEQMAAHYRLFGTYPAKEMEAGGAPAIEDFCQIIYEEALSEGVRPEVVYAQAMLETGWLSYQGGSDSVTQYNFAGLGTVGDGNPGNSFPDVRTGIRAQVQHLKAYACMDALNNACVDTRFNYVVRGSAPYVQWLGMQENPTQVGWASGEGYGDKIMKMISKIRTM